LFHTFCTTYGGVICATVLISLTASLQTNPTVRTDFFQVDEEGVMQREGLWWILFFPVYLGCGIYFVRFLGVILGHMWIRDFVSSTFVHQAAGTLVAGIMSDPQIQDVLVEVMEQPAMKKAASELTAAVLKSQHVQRAAAETVAMTLRDKDILKAAGETVPAMMKDPVPKQAVEAMIADERFLDPILDVMSRLLADVRTVSAVSGFLVATLSAGEVRHVIKDRTKSILEDPTVLEAGVSGARQSMVNSVTAAPRAMLGYLTYPKKQQEDLYGRLPTISDVTESDATESESPGQAEEGRLRGLGAGRGKAIKDAGGTQGLRHL